MAGTPSQELSDALHKVLLAPSPSVGRHREAGAWGVAITSSWAVFTDAGKPLPADVRRMVESAAVDARAYEKTRRRIQHHLDRIPAA